MSTLCFLSNVRTYTVENNHEQVLTSGFPWPRPLIGAFVVDGKGWRWTQWTLLFFAVQATLFTVIW